MSQNKNVKKETPLAIALEPALASALAATLSKTTPIILAQPVELKGLSSALGESLSSTLGKSISNNPNPEKRKEVVVKKRKSRDNRVSVATLVVQKDGKKDGKKKGKKGKNCKKRNEIVESEDECEESEDDFEYQEENNTGPNCVFKFPTCDTAIAVIPDEKNCPPCLKKEGGKLRKASQNEECFKTKRKRKQKKNKKQTKRKRKQH